MNLPDIFYKILKALKIHRCNNHLACSAALYVALQVILKVLFVFIVLIQITGKVLIMWKSKIICHIMHDFTKSTPVNAFLAFLGTAVNKRLHFLLNFLKGTEVLMLPGQKLGLDIWKDISKAKCLSVGLQTLISRHLVCQISGYQYMGFFTQPLPLLSCSYLL